MKHLIKWNQKLIEHIKGLMNFAVDQYWMWLPKAKMCSLQIFLFGAALICAISSIAADEYKVIETINGQVRGVQKTTLLKNIKYYSFKGIPYAKPPVGELRFKVNNLLYWKFAHLQIFRRSFKFLAINPQIISRIWIIFRKSKIDIWAMDSLILNNKFFISFERLRNRLNHGHQLF